MIQSIQYRQPRYKIQPPHHQMNQNIDHCKQDDGTNCIDENVGQICADIFSKLVHSQHMIKLAVIVFKQRFLNGLGKIQVLNGNALRCRKLRVFRGWFLPASCIQYGLCRALAYGRIILDKIRHIRSGNLHQHNGKYQRSQGYALLQRSPVMSIQHHTNEKNSCTGRQPMF